MQFAHHNYTVQAGVFKSPVPTRVVFGHGKAATLKTEVEELGGKRALVLSGKTLAEKTKSVRTVHELSPDCWTRSA